MEEGGSRRPTEMRLLKDSLSSGLCGTETTEQLMFNSAESRHNPANYQLVSAPACFCGVIRLGRLFPHPLIHNVHAGACAEADMSPIGWDG